MAFYRQMKALDFKQKTLVIPVVSTANVSQLTADLLIATLDLERAGIFSPKALVPVVGARDDGLEGATTALELYGRDDINVCVIQQRSPVLKTFKQEWVDELLDFISQSAFTSVILLAGMDPTDRSDAQMGTPIYHLSLKPDSTRLPSLSSLPIPEFLSTVSQDLSVGVPEPKSDLPFVRGGGLTRRILSTMGTRSWTIPTAALLQYVLEGDNRADAHFLAGVVAKVLGLDNYLHSGWKEPPSWRQGLFGTGHDSTLYG